MKKWPFGILRAPESGEGGGGGTGTGTSTEGKGKEGVDGEGAKRTFNINGKEIEPATAAAALNLYNALADPETGKEIIEQLARRTGLLDKDDNVKGDKGKAADKLEGKLTKMLKAKLGSDYLKFSDTIGPVMDAAIKEYLEEHAGTVEERGGAAGWESAVEDFTDTHTVTDDIGTMMERLIKRNGGRPNLTGKAAKEWLNDMYELAVHKLGIEIPDAPDDETDNRPRSRGRSRDLRRDTPEFREVARPKGELSVEQIVEDAMKGIRYGH